MATDRRPGMLHGPRALSAIVLLYLLGPAPLVQAVNLQDTADAVVKLYVTKQAWDIKQPWTRESAGRRICSGFLIKQGVLTNAHCVLDATFIQIEVPGLPDKIEAERVAVSHQIDLALVKPKYPLNKAVEVIPLKFGKLPEPRDKVVTVGYSIGGSQISYTEGVVSRIDVMPYAHSGQENLLVQTDAAINMGNSGGPVFSDVTGDCVGVATQRASGSIGYFIPLPVIEQFLTDLKDGRIDGVPYLSVAGETLENPSFREYLGMNAQQSGVLATRVGRGGSADPYLQEDDVILTVSGKQIFNDGRIMLNKHTRIGLGYEIELKQVGDPITFTLLRQGKEMTVTFPLTDRDASIIPTMPKYDTQPRYYLLGGLIFRAVEPRNYLASESQAAGDVPLTIQKYLDVLRNDNDDFDELVVIGNVYEAETNVGYANMVENTRVTTVNERKIRRLEDVIAAVQENHGEYHVIELESKRKIVLQRKQVEAEEQSIRQRYNIP